MAPAFVYTRGASSLKLVSQVFAPCSTPCLFGLITRCWACFVSTVAFRSNAFIRFFVTILRRFRHLVAYYSTGRFIACGIKVEDGLATGLDNDAHSDIPDRLRSSFDHVRSHW